ncbi:MAG: shikimate dehydrogenase [Nitratireductor sp.]|nr:shikimate dehydrogenase [Nitratireductor sp.]
MVRNRAFVMGHPIAQSRSPMMHGYWLQQCGIEGSYERVDVPEAGVAEFFSGFRENGWIGGNVTAPDKLAVIPYLDRLDEVATMMGSVNTIYWENGELVGGNTDATGFLGNLDELAPDWQKRVRRALVLGAGGAARAAAYGLKTRGIAVSIVNRTQSKAQEIAAHFGGMTAHSNEDAASLMAQSDLLVNATSLGMLGKEALEVDLSALKAGAIVNDLIYVPLETEILRQARERGHETVNGLGMLLHQGVDGFRRWFGKTPVVTDELRTLIINDIREKTPGA